jgi:nucleotide-binding universal stress UspA family protein
MKSFCQRVPQEIDHEYSVWEGNTPYVEILKYAREKNVDLIVMDSHTSHTKEEDTRWYVGSTVEQVSVRCPCPVMVVTHPKAILKI